MFDPSKLDLDLDENNNQEASNKAKKDDSSSSKQIKPKEEVKPSAEIKTEEKIEKTSEIIETSSKDEDILGSLEIVNEDSSALKFEKEIESEKKEDILNSIENKSKSENTEEPIENKEIPEEKAEKIENETIKEEVQSEEKKEIKEEISKKVIYDINITSLKDLLFLLVDKEFDFVTVEPNDTEAKLIFRKDGSISEERYVKFPIYSSILQKTKVLTKINLDIDNKPQEGLGEAVLRTKNYKVQSKVAPGDFGEKIFLKTTALEKKAVKKQAKKMTMGQIFTFLATIATIALIVGGSFIGFITMNAQSVEDVKFFHSLGINLNEINNFIQQVITVIFSILLLIESIFLVIFLFKFSLTKKEFKQKKIKYGILGALFLILTFSTFSAWMIIDKKVKSLPNWQEMSYGEIQVYDNTKLISDKFDKSGALLSREDTASLIGPAQIKFDLSFYTKNQESKGFKIKNFIWDFGDKDVIETPLPTIIKTFDKKGNNEVKLTIQKIDPQGKIIDEVLKNIPPINIAYLVEVNEEVLRSGGKKVSLDATDLGKLGKIEWYSEDNLTEPIWTGEKYIISKYIFEETLVGMYIRRNDKESEAFDKIFIISGEEKINIEAEIKESVSPLNDLEIEFYLDNIKNDLGNGFIEKYKWTIDGKEYSKEGDILNPVDASKIKHTFKEYGNKVIRVELTDSSGETKEITKTINIQKVLKLNKELKIFNDGKVLEEVEYDQGLNEYLIKEVGIPTELKFDARFIKSNDTLYTLQKVDWDYNSDGDIDYSGRIGKYEVNKEGNHTVTLKYTFQNYKIKDKTLELTEKIYIEGIKKEAVIDFKINKESNYVPTTIGFDASKSTVKDGNIVKFIWDYGDGFQEERDAIVPGHKYIKSGTYNINLKVITEDGREFTKTKNLVLNKKPQTIDIKASMKKAPIYQGIDFQSDKSEGQISSYFWNFGDGETSLQANPTHEYDKAGTYTVKLRLDFENKNTLEKEIKIEIFE